MRRTRSRAVTAHKANEHQEQVTFFKYVRIKANQDIRYKNIYAVPNAAKRSYRLASYLKSEGMESGVLDIVVDVPNDTYHGLRIEMKIPGNKPSEAQEEWIDRLNAAGYLALVAWSADQAISILDAYMITAPEFRAIPEVSSKAYAKPRKLGVVRQRKSHQQSQ